MENHLSVSTTKEELPAGSQLQIARRPELKKRPALIGWPSWFYGLAAAGLTLLTAGWQFFFL
jgi:hypothetical protein